MRFLLALFLVAAFPGCTRADETDPLRARGAAIAKKFCADCHAVGRTGQSPRPEAPPFRTLDERLDLDSLIERMRAGLSSDHPDMPTFRFSRQEARALLAYLRFLRPR
jgi:mono/diheme cytochrome c family protein